MFKFLVVASLVVLAVAQAPSTPAAPAPTSAPTTPPVFSFQPASPQSYALVTEAITGNTNCTTGAYYQNVYGATLAFGSAYPVSVYKTGVCQNTTSAIGASSIAYSYKSASGLFQSWTFATANCTGSYTVANLTTSCTDASTINGIASSTQTVAIAYGSSLPALTGALSITLYNGAPYSASFVAAGVCLRVPNPTGKSWNSTKVTCPASGSSTAATASYFSDNACQTPYTAPPSTPPPTPPAGPASPSPYSFSYSCANSMAPPPPSTPPTTPTAGSTPPGAPKAPGSSAANVVLSAAAVVAALAAFLF